MANKILKSSLGNAGACIDKSNGEDALYDVLKALVESHQQVVAQVNQLRTDIIAHPVSTTATAIDEKVELE